MDLKKQKQKQRNQRQRADPQRSTPPNPIPRPYRTGVQYDLRRVDLQDVDWPSLTGSAKLGHGEEKERVSAP